MISLCPYSSVNTIITPSGSPSFGQSYTLECSVNGTSDPATFQWLEGPSDSRTQITSDGSRTVVSTSSLSQLQFPSLMASHGGLYTCQAMVRGVVAEETTTVDVNRKCCMLASKCTHLSKYLCIESTTLYTYTITTNLYKNY